MDLNKKEVLMQKRMILKERLRINNYILDHILPWIEIYDIFKQKSIPLSVEFFAVNLDSDLMLFREVFQELTKGKYPELTQKIEAGEVLSFHKALEDKFPGEPHVRYVPVGHRLNGEIEARKQLQEISIDFEGKTGRNIMILIVYGNYTPVIQMQLSDLEELWDELFDPMENISIMDPGYLWMLFRSLEEDWIWIKK